MKKLFTLFLICSFSIIYSQKTYTENKNFVDRWDKYTNPNTDNYYYYHFKKYISDDLISNKHFLNNSAKIILEFNLDSDYNIENIRVNTNNEILKNIITVAFQEIDFSQAGIKSASTLHNYSIQILAIENGKAMLKCSSSILHEVLPIMEGCEQLLNFKDYYNCFTSNLEYYIENAFETEYISEKTTKIYPKLYFNKNGEIDIINIKSNDSLLIEGTRKAIKNIKPRFRPATLNGITDNYEIDLVLNSDNLIPDKKRDIFEHASSKNELAVHIKNQIPASLLKQEQLNLKNYNITLTYSYNQQNKIENIHTTAKNKELENTIIAAFNTFPSEKLIVPNKNLLSSYIVQVIAYENKENVIKCSEPVLYEIPPTFAGCEKSKTFMELRNCDQETLAKHVNSSFNSSLSKGMEPGVKRIFVMFTIGKSGEIENVLARAPNEALKNEATRVVEKFKIKIPGYQFSESVKVKYSLPIAFKVVGKTTPNSQPEKMVNKNPYRN